MQEAKAKKAQKKALTVYELLITSLVLFTLGATPPPSASSPTPSPPSTAMEKLRIVTEGFRVGGL